jgi:uncharacterized membrane protein YgdD (TMEM256/DUF423 family)
MKNYISLASVFGALAVILGAFGAHALKEKISVQQLQVFETGVKYQFYHAIALLILGLLAEKINVPSLNYSAGFFTAGILLFSGSLYLLSTIDINGLTGIKSILGPITPIGGLCFILGWVSLFVAVRSK